MPFSAIHYGSNASHKPGLQHKHQSSRPVDMETDITDSFHIYRVDWAHNNLWFYFDGKKFFEVDLNVNFQPGFYEKKRNGARIKI